MIELVCDKNRAFFRETEKLTSGSIGVTINFVFSPEWDGLLKTAVFDAGEAKIDVVLTSGSCEVPPEVLACPGKQLSVGVFGELADKTLVIPTIYAEAGIIRPGATPAGMSSAPPTPSWPEQVQAIALEAKEVADSIRSDADAGKFNGPAGEAGGFYTPAVTQPDENTLRVAFTPSKEDMPTVEPADIAISSASSGGNGADYSFLTGLKYYACGDSIVDIQGTLTAPETFGDSGYTSDLQSRNITDITVEGYVTAIEQRYGLVATNCGNSGHTLVQDYASLAAKDYSDVALVTIAYGCNDARTNVPLGTVNSTDVTTFAGALNQLLRKIYTDNPECRVIVLTPIQRLYVSDFGIGTANSNGNYLVDFVDMCKKVAAKRSTKCIDMYRDCGINQTNLYYYTVEGVHPVNQGFARMKGAIIPVLDDMFALEYEPFGTMTNTGDTEPDEPDTGGDSGGDETPPEEETGATVVDLSGLFVLAGQYYDAYGSFQNNAKLLGIDHPGVALEGGHTYTLITYLPCSADSTWAYGGALASNPSMDPTGGVTLSFGKAVGTFEVVTINSNYYGKCSYTFTINSGKTNYLYTSRAADLDDSYVSLTYI